MIIMAEQCEEGAQETKQALGIFPLPPPWHTSVFLFHLSHVMAIWVQGQDPPPPNRVGFPALCGWTPPLKPKPNHFK